MNTRKDSNLPHDQSLDAEPQPPPPGESNTSLHGESERASLDDTPLIRYLKDFRKQLDEIRKMRDTFDAGQFTQPQVPAPDENDDLAMEFAQREPMPEPGTNELSRTQPSANRLRHVARATVIWLSSSWLRSRRTPLTRK